VDEVHRQTVRDVDRVVRLGKPKDRVVGRRGVAEQVAAAIVKWFVEVDDIASACCEVYDVTGKVQQVNEVVSRSPNKRLLVRTANAQACKPRLYTACVRTGVDSSAQEKRTALEGLRAPGTAKCQVRPTGDGDVILNGTGVKDHVVRSSTRAVDIHRREPRSDS